MPETENAFGAIIPDSRDSLDRGWYCLGEGEPARLPGDGAAGLPAGPAWLTGLDYGDAADMGLAASSRFLNASYLRLPLMKLLARLGVPDDDAKEQARLASLVFSRTMNACRALFGRPDFLPARFLKNGLRVLLDPAPDLLVPKEDAERLDDALCYSHGCLTPGPREAAPEWTAFMAPPLDHCRSVLETPIPDGDFEPVPSLPPRGAGREAVAAWLADVTENGAKPGLFRCDVLRAAPAYSHLVNAGGSSGSRRNSLSSRRQWMTGPECAALAEYADLDVFEARVCEKSRHAVKAVRFAASLPPWANLSLTLSVVLDCLWHSLASPNRGRVRKPGRVSRPAAAPFLYAADQALLFAAARQAAELGFEVQGWSSGSLRVNAAGAGAPELDELCAKAGLLPALMHFDAATLPPPSFSAGSPADFLRAVEEEPSRGPEFLRRLLFAGDLPAVLSLDRLVLDALMKRREAGHGV